MVDKINQKDMHTRILEIIEKNGPSLPSRIARETEQSQLFAGAFLSELSGNGQLKMSKLKVGSSPLYLIPGQEPLLENFMQHLGSKEREACLLLKKAGILEDEKQTPAIRVALRSIRDFAMPGKQDNKIFWKYFIAEKTPAPIVEEKQEIIEKPVVIEKPVLRQIEKQEVKTIEPPPKITQLIKEKQEQAIEQAKVEEKKQETIEKPVMQEPVEDSQSLEKPVIQEPIVEEKQATEKRVLSPEEKQEILEQTKTILTKNKKLSPKDRFLEEVKTNLAKKRVEILEIEKYDKKQVFAKVKKEEREYILVAFNKKRFDESDLIKIHRKYIEINLPLYLLSKGEITKKTRDTIEACKKLRKVGKLE